MAERSRLERLAQETERNATAQRRSATERWLEEVRRDLSQRGRMPRLLRAVAATYRSNPVYTWRHDRPIAKADRFEATSELVWEFQRRWAGDFRPQWHWRALRLLLPELDWPTPAQADSRDSGSRARDLGPRTMPWDMDEVQAWFLRSVSGHPETTIRVFRAARRTFGKVKWTDIPAWVLDEGLTSGGQPHDAEWRHDGIALAQDGLRFFRDAQGGGWSAWSTGDESPNFNGFALTQMAITLRLRAIAAPPVQWGEVAAVLS